MAARPALFRAGFYVHPGWSWSPATCSLLGSPAKHDAMGENSQNIKSPRCGPGQADGEVGSACQSMEKKKGDSTQPGPRCARPGWRAYPAAGHPGACCSEKPKEYHKARQGFKLHQDEIKGGGAPQQEAVVMRCQILSSAAAADRNNESAGMTYNYGYHLQAHKTPVSAPDFGPGPRHASMPIEEDYTAAITATGQHPAGVYGAAGSPGNRPR